MGRPPTRGPLHVHRCNLAILIGEELDAGQRPEGPFKGRTKPWKPGEFGRQAGNVTATAVQSWRNRDKPTVPNNIYPILNAFYGDDKNSEYGEARAIMKRAFDKAGGNTDIEPDPWTIVDKSMIAVAEPVALMFNQPDIDNATGALRLPFTLQFRRKQAQKIKVNLRGKVVVAVFDLGLKEAWLSIASPRWQPTEGSLFRTKDKTHPRIGKRFKDELQILPADGEIYLDDEPLSDEPAISLEIRDDAGEERITLSVAADEEALKPIVPTQPRSLRQDDVIAAILRTATDRDRDGRIIVATETIMPKR